MEIRHIRLKKKMNQNESTEKRENFGSRLGFILVSAGCAIGLGNVWRFPYITGKYGGAVFVLIYLLFLLLLGLPVMSMEFSVGRASRKSVGTSFKVLEPKGTKWHFFAIAAFAGNYLLMMFYTTIGGWMLAYIYKMITGEFVGKNAEQISSIYNQMLASPGYQTIWMLIATLFGFFVCFLGLQNGVEKVSKVFMICLLFLLVALAVRSLTLSGAASGMQFYLVPNFQKFLDTGAFTVIYAAMGQAFFTLSIGMGSMAIFGSYIDKKHTLLSESITITALDTFVALVAGIIIFPACFTFGVNPDSGPGLVFVTLPNIFQSMAGGRIWGTMFFIFLSFAALTTIIAVLENIVAICMDSLGWSRKKAVLINMICLPICSLPCIFGFNLLSSVMPFGAGSTIMDLEDFLVSNNILPLGALVYVIFCTSRYGWGFKGFLEEVNTGAGLKFKKWMRIYLSYLLPFIILFIFVMGYLDKFFS